MTAAPGDASSPAADGPAEVIRAALDEAELDYTNPGEGQFFVRLPGTNKLATNCWLVVGKHAVLVEAFVCRKPDENDEEFQRFLLRRNAKTYGVSFALDKAGDVYLVGRLPLHAITADEVDRLLGSVLQYADESFGLVALEAQACGTPVVATDVGGLRTTVADGVSGLLVPGHDAGDWAAALRRALAQREPLSHGARAHASHFSWTSTASGLLATYRDALSSARPLAVAR